MDFLCDNFDYINSEPAREKILLRAFKEEKTKFLSKYFEELPEELQVEAVIKFKDLDLPEEILRRVMNK